MTRDVCGNFLPKVSKCLGPLELGYNAQIHLSKTSITVGKVLVIDHEPVVRDVLDTLLRHKGYDVILADGGRKGLELFHRERPDVIVLDVNMPEMDGSAILQLVRSLDANHQISIPTGSVTPETEQQVRALCVIELVKEEFPLDLVEDALKAFAPSPFQQCQSEKLSDHKLQKPGGET